MRLIAKWHIWLAWAFGIPVLMWTITGLIMVSKPIEEVRGEHLRLSSNAAEQTLPDGAQITVPDTARERAIRSVTSAMEQGQQVTRVTFMDGAIARFDASGAALPQLTEAGALALVARDIKGGDKVRSVTAYAADNVPLDFRRPMDVWQVALEDGAHIYVGRDSGRIEAVRTSWWRVFDFAWGLHIMDLETRGDTSHPILILFAGLGVVGSLLGVVLMFRRRTAKGRKAKRGETQV
jgi:hypothetical protein